MFLLLGILFSFSNGTLVVFNLRFGIEDIALAGIRSYLSNRMQSFVLLLEHHPQSFYHAVLCKAQYLSHIIEPLKTEDIVETYKHSLSIAIYMLRIQLSRRM